MIGNNYIIIDVNNIACIYTADNAKQAICKYAFSSGVKVSKEIFEKAVGGLNTEETIEFFNTVCVSEADKIGVVVSGFSTLYKSGCDE